MWNKICYEYDSMWVLNIWHLHATVQASDILSWNVVVFYSENEYNTYYINIEIFFNNSYFNCNSFSLLIRIWNFMKF